MWRSRRLSCVKRYSREIIYCKADRQRETSGGKSRQKGKKQKAKNPDKSKKQIPHEQDEEIFLREANRPLVR